MTGQRTGREVYSATSQHGPCFDVVVIGASAGGFHALQTLLRILPDPFPVPVAVVLHLSPDFESLLPQVLGRSAGRRVEWATDGSVLKPGIVYTAPPNRHLEIDSRGRMTLASTAPVNYSRPSLDRLFISAADVFGERALAVVLSGNGSDGTAGALAVCRAGGVVLAQDEASSEYFNMPRTAIDSGAVTTVLPLESIASEVTRLVAEGRRPLADVTPAEPNVKPLAPPIRPQRDRSSGA